MFLTAFRCILAVSLGQPNVAFKQFHRIQSAIEGTEIPFEGNRTSFRFPEQCLSHCVALSECDAAAYNSKTLECKLLSSSIVTSTKIDDDWKMFKQVFLFAFVCDTYCYNIF